MINGVTTKVNVDRYLLSALSEDITGEDVTTNAVMPEPRRGTADLICKQDGILCGFFSCWMRKRCFKRISGMVTR